MLISLLLLLVGCDSDVLTGNGGYSQKNVSYNLTCGAVECFNTDDQNTYDSGDYHTKTCYWYCGNYKGQSDKYVSLHFLNWKTTGYCWNLDYEYISNGICK